MSTIKKKIILTDVDGCLVKWQANIPFFLSQFNKNLSTAINVITSEEYTPLKQLFDCENDEYPIDYIEIYNNSDFIRYLPSYDDAISEINGCKYDFVAISSLSDTKTAYYNRKFNLDSLFPNKFIEIYLNEYGCSKIENFRKILKKYNVIAYVDDLNINLIDFKKVVNETNQSPLIFHLNRRKQKIEYEINFLTVNHWGNIMGFIKDE